MYRIFSLAIVSCLIAGCSPKTASMSGTVSYQGKTLAMGHVTVQDSTGQTRVSPIKADGSYEIKDVLSGPVTVAVECPDPSKAEVIQDGPKPPKSTPSNWFKIPDHYGDVEKTTLKFDLKPGPNVQDLKLE